MGLRDVLILQSISHLQIYTGEDLNPHPERVLVSNL